jgi:hypothetical protein
MEPKPELMDTPKLHTPVQISAVPRKPSTDYAKATARILNGFDPAPIYARALGVVHPYRRTQGGMTMAQIFPTPPDLSCACGCGAFPREFGRRRYANKQCSDFANLAFEIIYGNVRTIRRLIIKLHDDRCAKCDILGWMLVKPERLELDHITPVACGGGGAWLGNYQLLCPECHAIKTKTDLIRIANHQQTKSHVNY